MLNLNELQTILESVLPQNSRKLAEIITKSINVYFCPVLQMINSIQERNITKHEKAKEMVRLVAIIPFSDRQLVTLSSSGRIYTALQYKDHLIALCLKAREKSKHSLDCGRLVYF